ncbi:FecR domain-containing protein [Dyella sp. C11]|uniref:FecR family protein n=1 Tax=Dyella sp. C11 TaxID=2126991 RepID=UPI001E2FC426|nr:FecR domain-containing protein [Dyella sp. C11]
MIAGSVLSIALMALAGTVFWQQNNAPTYTAKIDTVRGQVREVDLPDGSHLVLDTDTHIEVSLFAHHRDVRLSHGQVMFVVEHDASRPFQVDAGGTRVTVLGTRFSVRYTESGLQDAGVGVAVEQGHVRVQNLATVDLLAQQAVNVDGRGEPGPVHALPPGAVAPWRQSHVNFNDTPLAAALAEFERYGPTDLALGDGRASRLRITGSFDVRQPEVFAHALPHVLAVRLSKRGDTTVIESSR